MWHSSHTVNPTSSKLAQHSTNSLTDGTNSRSIPTHNTLLNCLF